MQLKPLFFGRLTRILSGIVILVIIGIIGPQVLTIWGTIALVLLGISLIVGGFMGNPGCEITAIPNLFLSEEKKLHCT